MVFDVEIGDLTRKARFCANDNETDPSKESTFSTVVSRDSVRLIFLLVALNDLNILLADIQNAYLSAPVEEVDSLEGSVSLSFAQNLAFLVKSPISTSKTI